MKNTPQAHEQQTTRNQLVEARRVHVYNAAVNATAVLYLSIAAAYEAMQPAAAHQPELGYHAVAASQQPATAIAPAPAEAPQTWAESGTMAADARQGIAEALGDSHEFGLAA